MVGLCPVRYNTTEGLLQVLNRIPSMLFIWVIRLGSRDTTALRSNTLQNNLRAMNIVTYHLYYDVFHHRLRARSITYIIVSSVKYIVVHG